jgi:diguanylate cyclase (GGDEF)-like protein
MKAHSGRPRLQSLAARLPGDLAAEGFRRLLVPTRHPSLLARKRAEMVVSRVRLVAALFALLTPSWIAVDALVFTWPLSMMLAAGRLATSAAFAALSLSFANAARMADAYRAMAWMFAIPILFYLYSHLLLSYYRPDGMAAAVAAGYTFLPFVMVAGLSIFPFTAAESFLFSLPILLAEVFVAVMGLDMLSWGSHLGAFWLLLLLAAVAALSGMSQLSFMSSLVAQAARDPLTGCFSRASGEELLAIQFHIAVRNGTALAVVFVDLDDFKEINDGFGHHAGDRALKTAASAMRANLRGGDILLRWGGEEFVIILPNTDCPTAAGIVRRLREEGLETGPGDRPLTASYGIAERLADGAETWNDLVKMADWRMYQAKAEGKNRFVGCGAETPQRKHAATAALPGPTP